MKTSFHLIGTAVIRRVAVLLTALSVFAFNLDAQSQAFKGWPGHDDISDLNGAFSAPPKGYGNVPFYWWTGDSLNIDRLNEQLEILSDASTDGLCVSYNHTHDKVEVELNKNGHGPCGRVSGGSPRVMSEPWWKIWNEFSASCAKEGIGLGMDDYVIAWPKNGEFIDSILAEPSFKAYQGQLCTLKLARGAARPSNALTVMDKDRDSVTYICTAPAPWLHPDFGNEIVRKYFQPFVEHMDPEAVKGMNYFFQDELQYDLRLTSWSEDMPAQFKARKGYDIIPNLHYLFIDDPAQIDKKAAKVRLDYAEVLTQLAEERYFEPTYRWNAEKGLIYGCDPESRGKNPTRYLDYFRAISWFTAPGNDAPARGSSFLQTKVSASIAHLYGRPRTWLEAFHSMGWDANGALLKRQLDHHIIAGGNLLCMHGLYYSTHGGWWEWAPPCFHFRMPYWPHMKLWLKYSERMCFLLSQGTHVCDIAVLYPTETMQAIPGTKANDTFAAADSLSRHGLDYDFIDYASLQKAEVRNASLNVAGESYKVIVLAGTLALHKETLNKIKAFRKAGGIVVTVGDVMPELSRQASASVADPSGVVKAVRDRIRPDFSTETGSGRVLHRHIGDKDVYMVMDVRTGDMMHFRAVGKAECWNAMDGSVADLPVSSQDENGTSLHYSGPSDGSMLIVFTPGEPVMEQPDESAGIVSRTHIDGDWDIEIIPTMDNKWGDYRLPAGGGFIGVEARVMEWSDGAVTGRDIFGYGPYMMTSNVAASEDIDAVLSGDMGALGWTPYVWSWQYGVPDSPGNQGWHGLKSRVDPHFIILDQGAHQLFRTNVLVPEDGDYEMIIDGVEPYRTMLDGAPVKAGKLTLTAGWHDLLATYKDTRKTEYALVDMRGGGRDKRDRSMVVFYPASAVNIREHDMYASIVASAWYDTGALEYDIHRDSVAWTYGFETAPGTAEMAFKANGTVSEVLVDGSPAAFALNDDGRCIINIDPVNPCVSKVIVSGVPQTGHPGPAFFDGPVKMECRGGRMPEGDWTGQGALAYYSGGVKYSRTIRLDRLGDKVELDLGDVDATCEVSVNGCEPAVLIGSPYRIDITPWLREGCNQVEVLVYSSLANHYSTIPSPYRGTPRAGLIGPVYLNVYEQ